ncbi:metal ABC transporter substrate-binding protein [Deinococcus soli (ex Cha et al. 2016)]|uniref:ABC-type Zn uptake system ZnuABC Zn-binding protein ZnuA n=2 Tax=Deinococcus soli (ex Cha et al. 2016) TaxID=1309411 RepID=A0AAE3XC98_9DEIO|nr:metal ABC transporter substrate-binding protein [Deinococcus soli (ex Cha et al. 2016)]MDR6218034.1 ABC-type Zn uptake system ZnuABC Zn-binding protein ZnuA [Deinococcus soli (ex Cha et al. 2016)]MDR6328284.1 ABC-type Zn uptake system ZnuABC Zn-binding protein ZnuA [Deinococcus soli (ex Cha et al. 2016)]MDR6751136.1 ABC-type Zn uptake system ZnuABC Zn-binding protein ZnuA [Deinococcus soli (ex Cha et al. 2016)]
MIRLLLPAALLCTAGLLSGCRAAPPRDRADTTGRPTVLTTFTVLADMTRAVAGERAEVVSITKPGAEIHGYQPTPSDLIRAQDADLILNNGLNLERWFTRFTRDLKAPAVTLTEGIEPVNITADAYAGKPNPHAWMSPKNALIYVENIRRALSDLDPAGADTYRANAEAYAAQIREVDRQLATQLGQLPPERRALVTCEGAFSYLTRDYGLKELYLWPVNAEEGQGTPRQIRAVIDAVRAQGVPAVFCESTVSDKGMRQVARESGARYAGALHVDSLSDEVPTYLDLLRRDADTILAGLTGGQP